MISNPQLIERTCGGWLAKSSEKNPIQIGVLAETSAEAASAFFAAISKWEVSLEVMPDAASILPTGETQEPQSQRRSP